MPAPAHLAPAPASVPTISVYPPGPPPPRIEPTLPPLHRIAVEHFPPPEALPRITVHPAAPASLASGHAPANAPANRVSAPPLNLAAAPVPRITVAPAPMAPAGWGGRASEVPPYYADSRFAKLSDVLVEILEDLGVETAFGLIGGSIAPFAEALGSCSIKVVHCRHEGGAVFAAIEASFVSGRPSLVFTTTGPGLTNALTGVVAARRDGAKVILVSASTAAPQRGRWAFQETSTYTMPISGLFTSGPIFHYAVSVEQPAELPEIARRLAIGAQRPEGFVAHVAVPLAAQNARAMTPSSAKTISSLIPGSSTEMALDYASVLMEEPFAIWVGFGARDAAGPIRELAERTGAPVLSSPRGKGIFPEDHPQFVGVTGFGGHESVRTFMTEERPAYMLVLGTRLGEFTSFWDQMMVPSKAFIHVDLDPEVPGVAYPSVQTFGVQAEIGAFVQSLLTHIPARITRGRSRSIPRHIPPVPLSPRMEGPVRPGFLMEVIQRVIVEGSDAVVMTEAGNAFAWGSHALRFDQPGRYRVSTGFGSMGHATAGILGAALARRGKAVAICGDGAMLMNNEVSTAVHYNLPAVWIILNDAQYGMIDHGMRALGMDPVETGIPPCDFVMIARGMGADGVRVERESDVDPALVMALEAGGPFVVDVIVDPRSPAPFHRRNQSLNEQGAMGTLGKTQ
jgi:acetolactate synthase-1/2/3 large subunit